MNENEHAMTSAGKRNGGEKWVCELCGRAFVLVRKGVTLERIDLMDGDPTVSHSCQKAPAGLGLSFYSDAGPVLPGDLQDQIDDLLGGVEL